jgi:geranylgeranyl pyrophosphate synthase
MSDEQSVVLQARDLLYKHGQKGVDLARKAMLKDAIPYGPLQEAVQYFMASWEDVLHPALLGLACEAVGGDAEKTQKVGAALVLLAGGADLHDDIIDGSTVKDTKPTVLGKFGKDLTVLSGEALLFEGLYLLHEACTSFPKEQRKAILRLVKEAFIKLSSVEAQETSLHKRTDVADEYLDMIKTKSAVTEATLKIGAIIGEGSPQEIEILGSFGRTFSILFALRDEFIDTFEIDEVLNRYKNECLPLPVLLTLKNPKKAEEITRLLSKQRIAEAEVENLLDIVIDSEETEGLKREMHSMAVAESQRLNLLKVHKSEFAILLDAMIQDI